MDMKKFTILRKEVYLLDNIQSTNPELPYPFKTDEQTISILSEGKFKDQDFTLQRRENIIIIITVGPHRGKFKSYIHCKWLHLSYDWHQKVVRTGMSTAEYLIAVHSNIRYYSLMAVLLITNGFYEYSRITNGTHSDMNKHHVPYN